MLRTENHVPVGPKGFASSSCLKLGSIDSFIPAPSCSSSFGLPPGSLDAWFPLVCCHVFSSPGKKTHLHKIVCFSSERDAVEASVFNPLTCSSGSEKYQNNPKHLNTLFKTHIFQNSFLKGFFFEQLYNSSRASRRRKFPIRTN